MAKPKKKPEKKRSKLVFGFIGGDEPQHPACLQCGQPGQPNADQPGPPGFTWWFCANPKCPAPQPPHTWSTRAGQ